MNRTPRRTRLRTLSLASVAGTAAALVVAGRAEAQLLTGAFDEPLRPYYLQVSETLTYDSNLFRQSQDEDSDIISSTALVGGFDQRIGRQQVFGSAGVSGNVYRDNDQLNGLGYDLLLGTNWELGSSWTGNARFRATQNQASFADYGSFETDRTGRNRERATVLDLSAQYGRNVLGFEVLANRTDVRYSSDDFSNRDRESDMIGGGLRFRPGGPWSFGLTARFTDGKYPETLDLDTNQLVSDDYERRDIDLTANYRATGLSILNLRLTHTDEEHDLVTARDFDGLTGAITWVYAATGKTTLTVGLSRNTGSGAGSQLTFGDPVAPTDPLAPSPATPTTVSFLTDSRRSDRLSVDVDWQATGKIVVTAGASYSRDRYDTRFVDETAEDSDRTGNTKSIGISANYGITRAWTLACGLNHYSQDTSLSTGTGGSFGYDANTVYCTAALRLQ